MTKRESRTPFATGDRVEMNLSDGTTITGTCVERGCFFMKQYYWNVQSDQWGLVNIGSRQLRHID